LGHVSGEHLYRVSFGPRLLAEPVSLGIYENNVPSTTALAVSRSRNYVLLARTDGAVAMFDTFMNRWAISRLDVGQAGGAYGVLSDDRFMVGENVLDRSLSVIAKLGNGGTASSGLMALSNGALSFTTGVTSGLVHRISLKPPSLTVTRAIVDTPMTSATLTTPTIGQVGQSISPFTRTAALLPDESAVVVLTQLGFTMLTTNFDAPTPIPSVSEIRNMADGTDAIAPGALVLITGRGLAPDYAWADQDSPLPTALGETCVNLGDAVLPLFWVSPTGISAQVPFDLGGEVPLTVRPPGGPATPAKARIRSFAPAVFQSNGAAAVTRHPDGSLVSGSNPVRAGDTLQIYLTGMGQTQPEATAGQSAPLDALLWVTTLPQVSLCDIPLSVEWAGLVPGTIGQYQINAGVPSTLDVAVPCKMRINQGSGTTEVEVPVSIR
jgi:uncharacterized protein (TIGR03437 family)